MVCNVVGLTADPGDGAQHTVQVKPRRRGVPEVLGEHDVERQQESEGDGHLGPRTDDLSLRKWLSRDSVVHGTRCAVRWQW